MKDRILSIDVMRGMTIFFMIIVNSPGSWNYVFAPLRHAKWDGCTPTDLVFPFFVFIVGLSMSFSFRKFDKTRRSSWVLKIVRRTALIFLIGMLLNWFPFYSKSLAELRIFGVLQRIAVAYGMAGLLIVAIGNRYKVAFWAILVVYTIILWLFGGSNPFSLEENVVRSLDLMIVGENHMYHGYGLAFDPEGLLSSLPSVATVLFGYFIGQVLQKADGYRSQILQLCKYGLLATILGGTLHLLGVPINKPIWSSSYVLFSGGLASLFLAALIYIIDDKGWKYWIYIFRAFGLNPLISFVMSGLVLKTLSLIIIDGTRAYPWIYSAIFQPIFGNHLGSFLQALVYTMVIWLFAWWLYLQHRVIKL